MMLTQQQLMFSQRVVRTAGFIFGYYYIIEGVDVKRYYLSTKEM